MIASVPSSATVYTPRELAAAMVCAARGTRNAIWLDPCVGDGAFVREMALLGVPSDRIRAVDIAPESRESDALAMTTRGADFLEWSSHRGELVDHVVMNPPYVALNRVRGDPLVRALALSLGDADRLPLRANYWCAFVLRALECLRANGSMVVVLPAAWDFAKYAARVREKVEASFGELFVVRCSAPLFANVKEGVVVIAGFRRGKQPCTVRRVVVKDLTGTIAALRQIGRGEHLEAVSVIRHLTAKPIRHRRLDEIVDIRIGAVTGDSSYFLLTELDRLRWQLPVAALTPVLSRCKHLSGAFMGAREWSALRDAGQRVWLFRPPERMTDHPAVKRYLAFGTEGGCNLQAFKVSNRFPWHQTPVPGHVAGFLSGMSKRLPFLVLRDMPRLAATNTLYVIRFKGRATAAARATLGLVLLTTAVRRDLRTHARTYADGLLKFEPGDLGCIRIPELPPRPDAPRVLSEATALLISGLETEASEMADGWVCGRATPNPFKSLGSVGGPEFAAVEGFQSKYAR